MGADGLVLLDILNPQMTIFNSDGSKAENCGSALRCCCYLISQGTGNHEVEIKTEAGLLRGKIDKMNPMNVTVQIGSPILIKAAVNIESYLGDYISVGNPHFVIIKDNLNREALLDIGKKLSIHPFFDNGANIEFIRIISRSEIDLLVWERGAGATLACGTGAAAAIFSGQSQDLLDDTVKVNLPGGTVCIIKDGNTHYLSGIITLVGTGEYLWKI